MTDVFETHPESKAGRYSSHGPVEKLGGIKEASQQVSGLANKKCSVVLLFTRDSSTADSYFRHLNIKELPPDYELIFIKGPQGQINHLKAASTVDIKIVEVAAGLKLEELCLEAARQAHGQYIIFAKGPISCKSIVGAVRGLEDMDVALHTPPEEDYIIVETSAFIEAGSFNSLAQQQRENKLINKLINLVVSSTTNIHEKFAAARQYRALFEEGMRQIDFEKVGGRNFYKLMFLKSIKCYLDSGFEFDGEEECVNFFGNVEFEEVPPIPWYVGIILSLAHIKDDTAVVSRVSGDFQPDCAILVSVYNESRFTELCFKSIRKFTTFPNRIIAVNNSTIDMQQFEKAMLEQNLVDRWFNSGCTTHSEGLQSALQTVGQSRYIATLDCDSIVIRQNWLTDFISELNNSGAGLIGPQTGPGGRNIKSYGIHPCCMVIDRQRIDGKFQMNFDNSWPCDCGHLLTWDCLAHDIPIVTVSHEGDTDRAMTPSLINKSVRHYWCASTICNLDDDAELYERKVGHIREKLEKAYNGTELTEIRQYRHV
jgi:hypothetical protein